MDSLDETPRQASDGGGAVPASSQSQTQDPPAPAARPPWVFALGQIHARFSGLALEKEFAQVAARNGAENLTDGQVFQRLVADRANRYLARQMCWVFGVEGVETYLLVPRDTSELDLLIDSVRSEPSRDDVDVVIGAKGPIAPPDACNGLVLPMVVFDQLYSFDRDALIEEIPLPQGKAEGDFRAAAAELFDRVMQIADNAGAIDEHRALNYLAVRYPAIYATTAEAYERNESLTGVEVRPSRLSSARAVMDVIFSYTHRNTDVINKYFVRVDVTDEFPFLVSKMSPFYER